MEEEGFISQNYIFANAYDCIKTLLENKANPNILKETRFSPLVYAVRRNNMNIVLLLLKYNADPNGVDCINDTPLHYAAYAFTRFIPILLAHGAQVESINIYKKTPLADAIAMGNIPAVHLLLDAGAKISNVVITIPKCIQDIVHTRSRAKHIIVTFFALNKRTKRIHKDLTNVIGAMIWETRRDEVWAATPAFGGGRPTKK